MREVVQAFEAVGTSRPVELTPEQRAALRSAIDAWAGEAGDEGLPEGIGELRQALVDDGLLADAVRPHSLCDARSQHPADHPRRDRGRVSRVVTLIREPIDVVADEEGERDREDGSDEAAELRHAWRVRPRERTLK
jgi:hypothetical protein